MIDTVEKSYWIAFSFFEGIGPMRFKLLLDYFDSAKSAYLAGKNELLKIGLSLSLVEKFCAFRSEIDPEKVFALENNLFLKNNYPLVDFEKMLCDPERKGQLKWVAKYHRFRQQKNLKIAVLSWRDKEYPEKLKTIPSSPPVIYLKGADFSVFKNPSLAVVGTRKISVYGRQATEKLVGELSGAGLTIVSGMAYGIDSIAHKTALANKGKTIAVLGCGVDIIYPAENTDIYNQADLVVSEFPPGMPPLPGNFPARNRIIAGLTDAVLVIEAAQKSGALITAKAAAEQGKEVFAVPGPITSPLSEGTSYLIKQGAKLVYTIDDILNELPGFKDTGVRRARKEIRKPVNLSSDEQKVFVVLESEALEVDDIIAKTGIGSGKLTGLLTMMKLKGIVKELGGGYWGV